MSETRSGQELTALARPSKLTPEIAIGIVTLIEHGVHPPTAAGAYGVANSTLYEWLQRGNGTSPLRPSEPIYLKFAEDVAAAEYRAESALVEMAISRIKTTGDAVLLLERRFAERWQRREEVTVNLRREAEKIAAANGLDVDEIVAEAERILATSKP